MSNTSEAYKVSVRLMTYMHESYIKQAMDGIMMQEIDFKVEVVVGDDFSSDQTLDIIKSYENTEQIHIKILDRKKGDAYWQKRQELGRLYNFVNILENCSGKYIAILDGDDYWIHPLKLKKQVDFLENNLDYGLVHTDFNVFYENSNELIHASNASNNIDYSNIEDDFSQLLIKNHNATCTVMLKNDVLSTIDVLTLCDYPHGDLVLWFEMSQKTKFKYLNTPTAVYRVQGNSSSNSGSKLKRLNFLIGSKKIKMDYSAKYGTESQKRKAEYDYYHRVLIKATYDQDRKLATHAYNQLPYRVKKDYVFYMFTRSKFLNTAFLKFRKPSQSA